MQKCIFLVHKSALRVKHLGIPGVNYVLNDVGELVNLGLDVFIDPVLRVLFPLQSIDSHHVLLANHIETFAHLYLQLVFKPLEFLDLNKLDVFQGTAGRLSPLGIELLGQQGISRDVVLQLVKGCGFLILGGDIFVTLIVAVLILVGIVVHGIYLIFIT